MKRVYPWLGFLVAWAVILGTSIWLCLQPPTAPEDLDCPVHEAANPWCQR